MPPRKCPKCKLLNPEGALRCDCGLDFETGAIKKSYLSEGGRKLRKPVAWVGAVFAILALLRLLRDLDCGA